MKGIVIISGALTKFLIALVKFYRKYLSSYLGVSCRFYPTCSQYMIEALQVHGPIKGLLKGLFRVVRCGPWSKGGYDPIKSSSSDELDSKRCD